MKRKSDLVRLKIELEKELKGNILDYWMNNTIDTEYGGFVGQIDHFNRVVDKAPKGSVLNSRILWTFSAAYGMTLDERYLSTAQRAFDYILKFFMDQQYGGVFWEVDYRGKVTIPRKQIYALAFVIYGMTEYYSVTGNKTALGIAIELFRLNERYSLDKHRNGYLEAFNRNWSRPEDFRLSEKDANEAKTMNTHLHILEAYARLYREWNHSALRESLRNIIQLFTDRFVNPDTFYLNLFFDEHWQVKSDLISFGHDIECSWLLYEAAESLGDSGLCDIAKRLSIQMARKSLEALDMDHGLIYEKFPSENRVDGDRHWWPQAEAMVGYFNAYQLSGDDVFLDSVLNSWEFIKKYMIDKKNGEWYWRVDPQGKPYTGDEKAGFWKCPYHNGRACMELISRIDLVMGKVQ